MSDVTKVEISGLADLTAAVNKANEIKAAARVAQSDAAAIEAETARARERANAAETKDARDSEIASLREKIARFEAEQAAKVASSGRKSNYSLEDAREEIAETVGVAKAETKSLFSNLSATRNANKRAFEERYGEGRDPMDVIMRGAMVQERATRERPWASSKLVSVGEHDEVVRNAQDANDTLLTWRMVRKAQTGMEPALQASPYYQKYQAAMGQLAKALDTTDTSNWVPTGFSSALYERYDLARNLVNQFTQFQMPRSPFDLPVMGARTTTYKFTENTADPESATAVTTSDLTDAKVALSLVTLAARSSASYELDEDSIIPLMQAIREEQGRALAFAEEQAIIDGDVQGTHQDSDVTASTSVRKAFDGLRRMALANSYTTDWNSAFTVNLMKNMIKAMGHYGAQPSDLFWVLSSPARAELLTLVDTNNNPVMIGSTGQAADDGRAGNRQQVLGIPVVVSEAFRTDLNASGVYDGTTTTKTGLLLVNRRGFVYAFTNAAPQVESDKVIRMRQFEVVTSARREFEDMYAIASNKTVWYGYDIAST